METSSKENGDSGRPLDFMEIATYKLEREKGTLMYQHVLVLESSHEISREDIEESFSILSQKQETMCMRVVKMNPDDEFGYRFVPMTQPHKVDLHFTNIRHKKDWPILLESDTSGIPNTLDSESGPMYRVILANIENIDKTEEKYNYQYVIVLLMSHVISDGKSGFDLVCHQFLPVLSAVVNKKDPLNILPRVNQQKPVTEIFRKERNRSVSLPWYVRGLLSAIRLKNRWFGIPAPPIFKFPDEPDPDGKHEAHLPECRYFLLSKETTTAIIQSAKQQGVTVHSYFVAVTSLALCRSSTIAGVDLPDSIRQAWTIDMRKFLSWKSPQPLGFFISTAETKTPKKADATEKEFWTITKNAYQSIREKASEEGATSVFGVYENILEASRGQLFTEVIKEYPLPLCGFVTNVGNCDLGPSPLLTPGPVTMDISEQFFALTNIDGLHRTPLFHCVATFKGRIMWTLRRNPLQMTDRFARVLLENTELLLEKFCGSKG